VSLTSHRATDISKTRSSPTWADLPRQLANQFIATFYFLERHHDLEQFGPSDKIPDLKPEQPKEGKTPPQRCKFTHFRVLQTNIPGLLVETLDPQTFQQGQLELARDLIVKEQQIEFLISSLPGLDNSERDQYQSIKELEEELSSAEAQRLEAAKEKEEVLAKIDVLLRSIRRYR
jgi:mediator of RNA polymerase II transcription subunit 21